MKKAVRTDRTPKPRPAQIWRAKTCLIGIKQTEFTYVKLSSQNTLIIASKGLNCFSPWQSHGKTK